MAEAAAEMVGLDYNEQLVIVLRNKFGFEVIHGDAQDFSMVKKFDVVVAADVLEHLEDPKGFFASVKRSLHDQGRLLLTTPNPWFFLRFLRCIIKGDGGAMASKWKK